MSVPVSGETGSDLFVAAQGGRDAIFHGGLPIETFIFRFLSISISFGMDLPAGREAWSDSCDFELCEGFVFFLKTTAEGSANDDDDEQVNLIVRNVSIFFDKNDDGGGEDDDHDVDLPLLNLAWVLSVLLSFTMMVTLVGG